MYAHKKHYVVNVVVLVPFVSKLIIGRYLIRKDYGFSVNINLHKLQEILNFRDALAVGIYKSIVDDT